MKKTDARKQMRKLAREINEHNRLYYEKNEPSISDVEYDALFRELGDLETRFPDLAAKRSPTRKVGHAPRRHTERRQITHALPMMSLANTYDEIEVRDFDRRVRESIRSPVYALDPKIDGVAVALMYEDGRLMLAATRGNGAVGEEITDNVKTIRSLPARVSSRAKFFSGRLELRGEIYISKKNFAAILSKMEAAGEAPFANPRNTASGTLKLLDIEMVRERGLETAIHSIANRNGCHSQMMSLLAKAGFPVSPTIRTFTDIDDVLAFLAAFEKERAGLLYETDGVVIRLDSTSDQIELGSTSRAPRWAIAYKYPPDVAVTQLLEINLRVGRTGVVTPVAVLEPVRLSGTTVSSASLHNEDEIQRLDVRVGDKVRVHKGGEIIPQVIGVIPAQKRGPRFVMPRECPSCGEPIVKREGGVKYLCANPSCPASLRARILHFGSRTAMEIDGFGPAIVDSLLDAGLIKDAADIYSLSSARLAELPRLAEISARKLSGAIAASKRRPLDRLIIALGIPLVGEQTARDLAEHFLSLKSLAAADRSKLEEVPEIGGLVADAVTNFFHSKAVGRLIEKLMDAGIEAAHSEIAAGADSDESGAFYGKKIVVTGSVPGMQRSEVERAVRALGGRPQSSVSKQTDCVIVGDSPGSKYDKALKLGVATISADDFKRLIERD